MPDAICVVGLGNPGAEYSGTRHNIGFEVVDELAERLSVTFAHPKGLRAEVAEAVVGDRKVYLVKPTTFMNLSGEAVGDVVRYFKLSKDDLLVVHDEVDLPLIELRAKKGGGEGGHNGLRSVSKHLGTKDYRRYRFGVGRPPGRQSTADYVLGRFVSREHADVEIGVKRAADEIEQLLKLGFQEVEEKKAQPPSKSRRIKIIVSVGESIEALWDRWTTSEGISSFLGNPLKIGTDPGDAFELEVDPEAPPGVRGSEGCKIITASPPGRFAFSWNAPAKCANLREAGERTRVSLQLKRKGANSTLLTLTHTGWGEGPDWDECYSQAESAWPAVIKELQAAIASRADQSEE